MAAWVWGPKRALLDNGASPRGGVLDAPSMTYRARDVTRPPSTRPWGGMVPSTGILIALPHRLRARGVDTRHATNVCAKIDASSTSALGRMALSLTMPQRPFYVSGGVPATRTIISRCHVLIADLFGQLPQPLPFDIDGGIDVDVVVRPTLAAIPFPMRQ